MKEVKWGLIGCGDIASKSVAPAIRNAENSILVTVNRSDFSKVESFARESGAKKWTAEWQELVKDEEINSVYVATPVYLHADQTIAAAEAGKHVLCEKPMALNQADCSRMIDACKVNGVKLGVAYYRHLFPAVNRIKEIIESDEIGKVVHIQANNFKNFNLPPGAPRYWFLQKELSGGGPMMDMGCHRIEIFTNIAGPVQEITGFLDNIVYKREVEDTATAHFLFESGATAVLVSSHGMFEPQDTLDIFGSKGSIHVPVLDEGTMIIRTAADTRTEKHLNYKNFHQPLIDDFVKSILENRQPAIAGETGIEINALLDKIYSR